MQESQPKPVRVLCVEQTQQQYEQTRGWLTNRNGCPGFDLDWASTFDAGLVRIYETEPDACVVDFRLGNRDGMEFFRSARAHGYKAPIILLTGPDDPAPFNGVNGTESPICIDISIGSPHLSRSILDAIEQRKTQEALQFAQRLLDCTPDPAFFSMPDSRLFGVNLAACQALGYTREELEKLTVYEIDPNLTPDRWKEIWEGLQREKNLRFTATNRKKNGETFPVDVSCSLFEFNGDYYAVGLVRDITDQKEAERNAALAQERLRRQNQVLTDLAKSKTVAEKGRKAAFEEIAAAAGQTLGVDTVSIWLLEDNGETITGPEVYDVRSGTHRVAETFKKSEFAYYYEALERDRVIAADDASSEERFIEFREKYLAPAGVQSQIHVPIWIGGSLGGVLCIEHIQKKHSWTADEQTFAGSLADFIALAIERADHLAAEEKLRKQQDEHRTIFETAPAIIYYKDMNNRVVRANPAAAAVLGLRVEDLEGKALDELLPEFADEAHQRDLEIRATGKPGNGIVRPIRNRAGETRYVQGDKVPFRDESGNVTGMIVLAQDVTERVLAEKALRESEEKLRTIAENAPIGMFLTDASGQNRYINPYLCELLELTPEKAAGEGWVGAYPADQRETILQKWRETVASGGTYSTERVFLDRNGQKKWILSRGLPFVDATGDIAGYCGFVADITRRKQTEEELRQSEEMFRQMADAVPSLVWTAGADGQRTFVSRSWCDYRGRTRQQECGRGWMKGVHPEDLGRVISCYDSAVRSRINSMLEYRLRRHDGAYRWVYDVGVPQFDETGNLTGYVGSCIDIDERKMVEFELGGKLEASEQRRTHLVSIFDQLRLGVVMINESGIVTFVSETYAQVLGISPERSVGEKWESIFEVSASDLTRLKSMMRLPIHERRKVPALLRGRDRRNYWMEIEVHDDPRDPKQKVFFVYDMSEGHDLRELLQERPKFHNIIGSSPPMLIVYDQINEVAKVDSTVLIEGETGSGKEVVARAIHESSARRHQPFIAVNCAGLTDSLLHSQLFGHKRGSFTGAFSDQEGLFEAAEGGTLFLDEIGDIPMNVQTTLLRVLQEREIIRLGEARARKIDVRVLAATQHDLAQRVADGAFRADLLYRIRVARIPLPPLRERREDIPLLAAAYLAKRREETGKAVMSISSAAIGALLTYSWPGNVRELHGAIEYALIRCPSSTIEPCHLPPEVLNGDWDSAAQQAESERSKIISALRTTRGNRKAAANLLGMSRATFYRKLAEYDLVPTRPRKNGFVSQIEL